MEISYEIIRPSCFNSSDGKIKLHINNTTGKVFINWLNLPQESFLSNSSKTGNSLPCGEYVVEIEDDEFYGNKKKSLLISIPQQDELKFDFIKVSNPVCYNGEGTLDIFWKGGVPPYTISINSLKIITEDTSLIVDNLKSSIINNLSITDSLDCQITYPESIIIHKDPIIIDLSFDPIPKYSTPSPNVSLSVQNAQEPIKIAWYKYSSLDSPLFLNQSHLVNQLYSGKYLVKVIDNNGCYAEKTFKIDEPEPIKVKLFKRADYSFNSYFPLSSAEKIYTTIIVPSDNDSIFTQINLSDQLIFEHKKSKTKSTQIVVSTPYELELFSTKYTAIDISPGIPLSTKTNDQYNLTVKNESIVVSSGLNKRNPNSARLIIRSIIINDNIKYKIAHNTDWIQVFIDQTSETGKASDISLKSNFYAPSISTKIDIDPINSINLIYFINKAINLNKLLFRSLSKKMNNEKGQISLTIRGGVRIPEGVTINGYKYKIVCTNHATNSTNTYYANDTIIIKDLDKGKYSLDIRDIANNSVNFINGESILTQPFEIDILGSIIEEQQSMPHNLQSNTIQLGSSIKRFASVRNSPGTSSILINLKEPNTLQITGPNNYYQNLTTKYMVINNLSPGKYTISNQTNKKDIILFSNQTETIDHL